MEIMLFGILGFAAALVLLIVCPSPAKLWEAAENYCADRKFARLLIDARQASRREERMAKMTPKPQPAVQVSQPVETTGRRRLFA